MNRNHSTRCTAILAIAMAGIVWAADGERRSIDTAKSTISVHVSKSGALSAFGHDHDISAPIAGGTIDTGARRVELHVNASAMRVRDAKGSAKDHDQVQKTMVGPEVLDVEKYPEIRFRSTSAEGTGAGAWTVHGELTLHGQTRPITVEARENGGHFVGSVQLRQTEFGIKPVKVAGGTVKVKDEVRIQFDIQAH